VGEKRERSSESGLSWRAGRTLLVEEKRERSSERSGLLWRAGRTLLVEEKRRGREQRSTWEPRKEESQRRWSWATRGVGIDGATATAGSALVVLQTKNDRGRTRL
jgi:hypothetical protein